MSSFSQSQKWSGPLLFVLASPWIWRLLPRASCVHREEVAVTAFSYTENADSWTWKDPAYFWEGTNAEVNHGWTAETMCDARCWCADPKGNSGLSPKTVIQRGSARGSSISTSSLGPYQFHPVFQSFRVSPCFSREPVLGIPRSWFQMRSDHVISGPILSRPPFKLQLFSGLDLFGRMK